MRFTQSPDTIAHPGTGNRMHTDAAPIPSAVTADDMNMILWELNAIRQAAAIVGVAFNPADPASYTQVLQALNQLFITPAELASYAPSATDALQGLVEMATSGEGITGADFTRAVSPGVLAAVLAARSASEAAAGLARFASAAQTSSGGSNSLAVHPAGLAPLVSRRPGHVYTTNDWYWVDKEAGVFDQYWFGTIPTGTTVTLSQAIPNAVLGVSAVHGPSATGSVHASVGPINLASGTVVVHHNNGAVATNITLVIRCR